jgi:hypothetical protein
MSGRFSLLPPGPGRKAAFGRARPTFLAAERADSAPFGLHYSYFSTQAVHLAQIVNTSFV